MARHSERPISTAAFAAEDVEDSRRAAPSFDLRGYAAARNLTFVGSRRDPRTLGVAPEWDEHVFNQCNGVLGGARPITVFHELHELSIRVGGGETGHLYLSMGGEFHGVKLRRKMRLLDFVPFGELLTTGKGVPFPDLAASAPATTVAVHVPEAALVPAFRIRPHERFPEAKEFPLLDAYGLPGMRISGWNPLQGVGLLDAVVGSLAPIIATLSAPYLAVEFAMGTLAIRRNGFQADAVLDADLGHLVRLANALAAAVAPAAVQNDFAQPFPEAAREERLTDADQWGATFDSAAKDWSLRREDPVALHRAYPTLPVPGRSRGVLSGTFPNGITARMSFHQHRAGSFTIQPAALFPVRPGSAPLPQAGIYHQPTDMWVGTAGDLVACWSGTLHHGELATATTTSRGLQAAQALGVVG